jgi:uncharacterized protein
MNICLKTYARQTCPQTLVLHISERLPSCLCESAQVNCTFQVQSCTDFYLLSLSVKGDFTITCQRCLGNFKHALDYETQLAVCRREEMAESLMEQYDCIVSNNDQLDLLDVLTDELHLNLPEKHPDEMGCDVEMTALIVN